MVAANDYFPNPFVVDRQDRNRHAEQELRILDIRILEAVLIREVSGFRSNIIGVLTFENDVVIGFERHHSYWSVSSSSFLPLEQARALNDRVGNTVRVDGMSRGTDDIDPQGCDNWNVDTRSGLLALVTALRDCFGTETITPVSVRELGEMKLINSAVYG